MPTTTTTTSRNRRVSLGVRVARWGRTAGRVTRWLVGHVRFLVLIATLGLAVHVTGRPVTARVGVVVVVAIAAGWAIGWPVSYEARVAGPQRRWRWRRWARSTWPDLTQRCGLARTVTSTRSRVWDGATITSRSWWGARLREVRTQGSVLSLTVRADHGQTVDDLERAAPAIRDAAGAHTVRVVHDRPGVVVIDLTMTDHLAHPTLAVMPTSLVTDRVLLGIREDGHPWDLVITERHTLITGCAGAGKGSVFWGIAGSLAPAVHAGLVRLYGIDLKYGLEVNTGRALFTAVATDETTAITLLTRVAEVMAERGARMSGHARAHHPTTAEPLVVVMIDELATLTAYVTDKTLRKQGEDLLAAILSKGRALGVLVIGALQDPRKEVIPTRGLFTQTIALRLRSREEVTMVLGEGMADRAPAHRIAPTAPGTGYVIAEDGATAKVRAAYWPDHLIRAIATCYPTSHRDTLHTPGPAGPGAGEEDEERSAEPAGAARPRRPRSARTSREPRAGMSAGGRP
ncbi:MAG TPA: FtsK/SpoIIIE domain-containing protein [Dermatophilaceae bacterium]|nr:FtsK/SpoIIIE domain-containing protein [Dermatophilaceae bacterium]